MTCIYNCMTFIVQKWGDAEIYGPKKGLISCDKNLILFWNVINSWKLTTLLRFKGFVWMYRLVLYWKHNMQYSFMLVLTNVSCFLYIWPLDVSQAASCEITLVRLSVCPSARTSLSFLKTGSLVFFWYSTWW